MRIGIWCDYGFTLGPTEGIGVFVDNLARGLVRGNPECQIRLMAHPGQEDVLDSTVRGGLGRIEVIAPIRQAKVCRCLTRLLNKIRRRWQQPQNHPFVHTLDQCLERLKSRITARATKRIEELIQSCDVWLVPYVGLEQEFSKPTVVVIHDLVSYHFPEMLRPDKLKRLKAQVDRISSQSTLAACMSEFIRDHDLIGTLGLPSHRVRVIKAAVPDDICNDVQMDEKVPSGWLTHHGITGQYLFYPAAFRAYKNHRFLVDALQLLSQRTDTPWKLVFTGINQCPPYLQKQIDKTHTEQSIVILGKVTRAELKHLYQNAIATIVPSLYEQGSFPVMEALACRCPVAASDIPSLREQFSPLESSMLFFDPHNPQSLLPIIEKIQQNRDELIELQSHGFNRMREYTWETSGRAWMALFRETLALNEPIHSVQRKQNAA